MFFDLETTGQDEITQITATCQGSVFSQYVLPAGPISKKAAETTGLSIQREKGEQVLAKLGRAVPTLPLAEALSALTKWLSSQRSENGIVMAAHNCFSFDSRVLALQASSSGMATELFATLEGFADTLPAFREALPKRNGFSQPVLYHDLIGGSYSAHDAHSDVEALAALVKDYLPDAILAKHCVTASSTLSRHTSRQANKSLLTELLNTILRENLSASMAEKVAMSGLSLSHLKLAFSRNGKAGVGTLLSEKGADGKPRVTKTASVVQKLVHFLEMPADGGSNSKAASSQPLLSAATSSQPEISAATSSQPEVSAATTSQPELSAERLALFEKRRANGYDIPDPAYLAWLAVQV